MTIKKFVYEQIGTVSDEKKEFFDLICDMCQAAVLDDSEVYKILEDAVVQYKEQEYNLFEKSIDSLLNLFGLTTTPIPGENIDIKRTFDTVKLKKKVTEISLYIDNILTKNSELFREVEYSRKEISRLSVELNSVNGKLASLIQENSAKDKMLVSHIQRILVGLGKTAVVTEDTPLGSLLDELDLTYSWDMNLYPDYFAVYQISDESKIGIQHPVIMRNGKVIQNGLAYVLANNNE